MLFNFMIDLPLVHNDKKTHFIFIGLEPRMAQLQEVAVTNSANKGGQGVRSLYSAACKCCQSFSVAFFMAVVLSVSFPRPTKFKTFSLSLHVFHHKSHFDVNSTLKWPHWDFVLQPGATLNTENSHL